MNRSRISNRLSELKVRNMIKNALATHYKPERKKKNPTAFDEAVLELYADKKDKGKENKNIFQEFMKNKGGQ